MRADVQTASDTSYINASVQTGAAVGLVDVQIEADCAYVEKTNGWTYLRSGAIDAVPPFFGQKGTTVTISGVQLRGGDSHISWCGGYSPLESKWILKLLRKSLQVKRYLHQNKRESSHCPS